MPHTELLPEPLPPEPLVVLNRWMAEAWQHRQQPNPNSMVLATTDSTGHPSARVVLCKEVVPLPGYLVFYTNYLSRKGRQLADNPRAAAVIHWDALHRQVRIEGHVLQAPPADSDRLARGAARGRGRGGGALRSTSVRSARRGKRTRHRHSEAASLGRISPLGGMRGVVGGGRGTGARPRPLDAQAHANAERLFRGRILDGHPTSALVESSLAAREVEVSVGARCLVAGLSLEFAPGEFVAILGRNGTGKTLTLHTLAGLRRPQAGAVYLDGVSMESLSRRTVALRLGLLAQDVEESFVTTAREAVLVGRHPHLKLWQWETVDDERIAQQALTAVDLEGFAERRTDTLSGGELRRMAVAALLAQQPALFLLDEPSKTTLFARDGAGPGRSPDPASY
jgi:energy-coupling factor transporter ATP-binding protein EcfA2